MTDYRPILLVGVFALALIGFTTGLASFADNGGVVLHQTHSTPEMMAAFPALF